MPNVNVTETPSSARAIGDSIKYPCPYCGEWDSEIRIDIDDYEEPIQVACWIQCPFCEAGGPIVRITHDEYIDSLEDGDTLNEASRKINAKLEARAAALYITRNPPLPPREDDNEETPP